MVRVIFFPCLILLHGCSFNGLFLEGHENKPVVIIEHPPNRVAYGGNLNPDDIANIQTILRQLARMPYKNHEFKYPLGVALNSDSKESIGDSFSATSVTRVGTSGNIEVSED